MQSDSTLKIEQLEISALKPNPRNARKHPQKQIAKLAANMKRFGFPVPVLIDQNNMLVAGHGRLEAAKQIGLTHIPAVRKSFASAQERSAYALADNRLAELSTWDEDNLRIELEFCLDAADGIYDDYKQLIVWKKSNGAMGTFYRSQHELVFVFKSGTAKHVNNFGLGETGRYRTNVVEYAGCNTFRKGRKADLEAHSTVKPTAMVADFLLDCSHRGDLVLDPFLGSGTTLLAAHKTGRRGRGMEIDPLYCDAALRRLQSVSGIEPVLEATGETFSEVMAGRLSSEMEG